MAHATSRTSEHERPARVRRSATEASSTTAHPVLRLQRAIGNRAVASLVAGESSQAAVMRIIQRVSIGTAPTPKPTKTWEVMGGFASKHLVEGAISIAAAKQKWTERYASDKKGVPNTVASKEDFTAAVTGSKVSGTYPAARGPRGMMTVEVKGYTVFPTDGADGKKIAGRAKQLSKMAVVGNSSDNIYFPDHFDGKNSS